MSVSFESVPSNLAVPLFFAEMDNSKANTAQTSGASLLIGQALSAAAIERNKLVLMPSADQARKLCGQGSQLARMVDSYRKSDPFGELYVVAVSDADKGAVATSDVAISGTATAAGAISLYVGSTRVQGVVSVDDTALQAAQSLADAINAIADLPVTATASEVPINIPVTGIGVTAAVKEVVVGSSITVTAKISPDTATNKAVTWKSSDATILKIGTSTGLNATFTGVKEGKATVTAVSSDGDFSGTAEITVKAAAVVDPTGVTLDKTTANTKVGDTVTITATVAPSGASQAVEWSSDDATLATVNSSGVVTGVKTGVANITATCTADDSFSATCAVTVAAAANKLSSSESATAKVTLTAKYPGISVNNFPLVMNYYGTVGGEETPAGLNVQIADFSGGAGSVDLESVIAALGDESFDYIGLPFNDANSLALMREEMNDTTGRWAWSRQIYGHVYTAKIAELVDLVEFGDSFNDQHLTVCGYEIGTQSPVDELIAGRLGRQAAFLRNDPARPTQTGEITGALPAPVGTRYQITERQSLLTHGIATSTVSSGSLLIERDITTYKKNKFGVTDNSYLDSETLHTSAYVLRKLKTVITSKYPRHKLADDGTRFGQGQAIVTPSVLKGEICAAYRQMELAGIVENFDTFKKYLLVERNADNPNRVDVLFPPDYVNQLRVFAVVNQFRLQYSDEEINA